MKKESCQDDICENSFLKQSSILFTEYAMNESTGKPWLIRTLMMICHSWNMLGQTSYILVDHFLKLHVMKVLMMLECNPLFPKCRCMVVSVIQMPLCALVELSLDTHVRDACKSNMTVFRENEFLKSTESIAQCFWGNHRDDIFWEWWFHFSTWSYGREKKGSFKSIVWT